MSRMASMNISGLAPAVPAKMKLAFMKAPKKAAMPVNRPKIRARPTRISPKVIEVREQRGVGYDRVLEEPGVPLGDLRVLAGCLSQRSLRKAFDSPAGTLADPATLGNFADALHKPEVAKVYPNHEPKRSHPGVCEQEPGQVRFGDLDPARVDVCAQDFSIR
jgi:hypothetical protein